MPQEDLDPVERDYLRAINNAADASEAYELAIGLAEYRKLFKLPPPDQIEHARTKRPSV